ncbi:hypothetical protein [Burkholderia dolosa]|uniref:hypothetical protein n=1 Tax=Burkholderia dolosa TaxID=152500 RepID=UPI00201257B0|nr:hypothetical protein [Burkholderia dolosa]
MSAKFYFYFFGISDRWRIERVDGAQSATEIPEKTAGEPGGFFSPFACRSSPQPFRGTRPKH